MQHQTIEDAVNDLLEQTITFDDSIFKLWMQRQRSKTSQKFNFFILMMPISFLKLCKYSDFWKHYFESAQQDNCWALLISFI